MFGRISAGGIVALMVFGFGLVSGCAQRPAVWLGQFPIGEYEALHGSGQGKVVGQLFLRTVGGDVKYGAGENVVLMPATSYSQKIHSAYISNASVPDLDPRINNYNRRTQADGEGRFVFDGVAPGKYYVGGNVIWHRPSGLGPLPEGGFIMKEVIVPEGGEATVMVTR